jgi:hypothetical protein
MKMGSSQGALASPAPVCLRNLLALVVCHLVLCGLALGQGPGASRTIPVNVSVSDENNHPVADAKIEVNEAGNSLSTVATDAAGKAATSVPVAGNYRITISKPGFVTTDTTLDVTSASAEQTVDVVISSAALSQQSINVTGEPDNPVTDTAPIRDTLAPAQAKNAPSNPATLNDALPLVPGVVRGPDGTVRIAGFGEDHSALLVNSVDVTDPSTGGFGLSVPIDSVQTIEVAVMPYLAQYGKFTAGVVTAETRRGGDKWDYSLNDPFPDFRIRSGHLNGIADAAPRFNVSGPLMANRIYFLEGAEYLYNSPEVRTLPFPENLTTSKAFNSFTQLDFILTPKQTLTGSYHFAPHSVEYAGLDYFNPQPVTPNADFHETTATLVHRWAIGDGLLKSTLAGTSVSSSVEPQANTNMVLTPGQNTGNYFAQQSRDAGRYQWIEEWSPRNWHFAGEHSFKVGSVVGHSDNEGQFQANPVVIQNSTGQTIQQIRYVGGKPYDVSDTSPAFYAQDHWVLNSHVALDAGLRFEGQTITSTKRTAPRMGMVWSPDTAGKTVVRGGIGIFYDAVPLDVYAFNSYPEQLITTYDAQGLPIGSPIRYINLTDEAASSKFPFINRKLKSGNFAPYSVAWNMEVERVISRALMVRVKYLQSNAQGQITLQPEIVDERHAMVLGSEGSAQTRQAELTARIGADGNRQFYFSYVRQYAYGDINSAAAYLGNFPSPVVQSNFTAALPSEIPNRFLLCGNYALPRKFSVAPHVEYRDGFPFQATDVWQQWIATPGPQYRLPHYFALDLRMSKELQVNAKHAVKLSVTVRNLTNHSNPLEVYSNNADSQYGRFFGNYDRKFLFDFDFLY